MSEELVNIEVDGVPMKARKNAMLIQVDGCATASTSRVSATTTS